MVYFATFGAPIAPRESAGDVTGLDQSPKLGSGGVTGSPQIKQMASQRIGYQPA
jgi:hypothetical protein